MTANNTLEVGDLILFQTTCGADLVMVDIVYKKVVKILMPGGFHLLLDRTTDGVLAYLPKAMINPFAIMTVIPKNNNVVAHTPFVLQGAKRQKFSVTNALRQFLQLFQPYYTKADLKSTNCIRRSNL
jgi:hypothetical protein